jgi:microsomal dipeptidase-like Zn-dependent dipeptidase
MPAFASSAGWGKGFEVTPIHPNNGLSDFGRALVLEMNRLGSEFNGTLSSNPY